MGSFSIPLSGLTAAQDQLQSVSNNLSNLNTDGYKDQNVLFGDIFAQTGAVNGSGDPMQTGLGVSPDATVSNFSDGTINPTGIPSNMALSGAGFFAVRNADGSQSYTRAGDFMTNNAGYLNTPAGDLVLGYPAVNGVVKTSAPLQPLQVGTGVTIPAVATSTVNISANLNSNTSATDPNPTSTLAIYDTLGAQHELTVTYSKTGSNTWSYTVTIPTADLAGGGSTTTGNTTVGSGNLNFDGQGNLTSITGVVPISIPSYADGATAPQNITGPFAAPPNSSITQTSAPSATSATTQNGYASGTLQTYSIESDGTIQGTFSSGKTLALGQVAVATFANNQGLSAAGNNNFNPTAASGSPVIGIGGTGGRGTITGGAVEQSNVDIATEFSKLIVAQQAYSANAKMVTTAQAMLQTTIDMKQ